MLTNQVSFRAAPSVAARLGNPSVSSACALRRPQRLTVSERASRLLARSAPPEPSQQAEEATQAASPSPTRAPPPPPPPAPEESGSGRSIAAGAAVAAVVAFAVGRLLSAGPSLATLEDASVPLDIALANGKPTVIEFYASWCEVCKSLVPFEYEIEEAYRSDVNFVMLNVENSKWAPEVAQFNVGGIPHFVFMDGSNKPLAAAVGKLPEQVLQGNVAALAEGRPRLPFAAVRGEVSAREDPAAAGGPKQAMPRDHS